MKITALGAGKLFGALFLLGLVVGCASSRRFTTPPTQLEPVIASNVQSSALPPLTQANNSGDPLLQDDSGVNTQFGFPEDSRDPLLTPNGAPALLTLPGNGAGQPNAVSPSVATHNLSGGLSVQKLLGSWTIISGSDQCQLNLTQTLKTGTERYRASAPNCTISTLSGLASWKLIGSQVQFYNVSGQLIGALLQSGNRLIGTLAGGQGVSMVG